MNAKLVVVSCVMICLLPGCSKQEPPAPQADVMALVKGNNAFAVDLYGKLRHQDGNLFLAPYSISTALGMTYAGARGNTASQMKSALHFPFGPEQLNPAFRTLIEQTKAGKGYQLSTANAMWCQRNVNFLDAYLSSGQRDYFARLQALDFQGAAEESRQTINAWVEKQTASKIKDLVKPGMLNADTRMVLTSAIYFKGNWVAKFDKKATQEKEFVAGATRTKVPMMHEMDTFGYLDGDTFQALEMHYVDKELSMVVFLPKKPDGLAELEQSLTAEQLAGWLGKLKQDVVAVRFPRFQMTSAFELSDALRSLGMSDAFSTKAADFSGISSAEALFMQAVLHQAFVEVNEEGTQATAAVGKTIDSVNGHEVFNADHPFFFVIRDTRTGGILFMGRLVNP